MPPVSPPAEAARTPPRAVRARALRRRIAIATVALLLISWNAVDVWGAKSGGGPRTTNLAGSGSNGSVDVVAPVTSQQS